MKKVLIIAAHPDDETLGCGGTINLLVKKNHNIKVLILGEGSSCRFTEHLSESKKNKIIMSRENSCIKALKKLGVKKFKFNYLPCGRFDTISIIDIARIIENEIKKFNPEIIFTHSSADVNNDHRITFQATLQSTRPAINNKVRLLLSYEVLSSTERNFISQFKPNYFIPLSKRNIDKKIKALKFFKSEIKKFPFPRSSKGVEVLSRFRGLQSGNDYAEAFCLVRQINNFDKNLI